MPLKIDYLKTDTISETVYKNKENIIDVDNDNLEARVGTNELNISNNDQDITNINNQLPPINNRLLANEQNITRHSNEIGVNHQNISNNTGKINTNQAEINNLQLKNKTYIASGKVSDYFNLIKDSFLNGKNPYLMDVGTDHTMYLIVYTNDTTRQINAIYFDRGQSAPGQRDISADILSATTYLWI